MLFVEVLEDEEPQVAATRATLSADAAACSATLKRVQSTSWPSGLNNVSSHCADSVQSMTTGSRFVEMHIITAPASCNATLTVEHIMLADSTN